MSSRVVSRVAALGSLTAAGQFVIVGSLPAYSRIFDPGPYGQYVVFVGAYTVISVVAGLRYDSAIVLPRNDAVAGTLSVLVMLIAGVVSIAIAAATVVTSWTEVLSRWLTFDAAFGYGLAVATLIGALQRCLVAWCVRSGRFLTMGMAQFVFCVVTVAAQFWFARFIGQLAALVWGYVAALAAQTLCLSPAGARARLLASTLSGVSRAVKVVARKYRRFPTFMVGYALASSARDRLIQIVLGFSSGAAVVGRFGLAYRVIYAPNSLIYSAVSPIFYGIASRGAPVAVGRFAAALVETVFVLLLVPYVAFTFEAPSLTDAVLSEKWHGTGPYLQALAGPALLLAATCWLDRAFDSFRRQNVAFSLEASFTIASVAVVGVLARYLDSITVAWAFGGLAMVYYWIYFLATFKACGFDLADFRRACTTALATAAVALALGWATHRLPGLEWRVPAYALLMGVVLGAWIGLRGGRATLRMLMQSRVAGAPG